VRFAGALLFVCLLPAATGAAEPASGEYPLLDLARELASEREAEPRLVSDSVELRHAEHALEQARAPSDEQCSRSLGSGKFAELHMDVAGARLNKGDVAGSLAAYRRAHACRPRSAHILGRMAEVMLDARDFDGARAAVEQALAIDPRDLGLHRTLGYLDFIAERWADAIARFRYVASSEPDRELAAYGQLMFWLSQLRAGMRQPEFVSRRPVIGWPHPLMLYLKGEFTEAELLNPIRQGDDDYAAEAYASTDARLCAALFYVGQSHWARGRPDLARSYFAALVNLRQPYYAEHGLALAEIAKLNSR
jgi:tetratricopeptide (TPR) repeat protein